MSKQSKEEIVAGYDKPDPWGYKMNPEDSKRKDYILDVVKLVGGPYYLKALDIGCGEAWLTDDLPAKELFGYELSEKAKERWPSYIRDLNKYPCLPPKSFELVTATGVLYHHYDYEHLISLINIHAANIILTCNIEAWEIHDITARIDAKQIFEARFPYREYTQKLRVFKR